MKKILLLLSLVIIGFSSCKKDDANRVPAGEKEVDMVFYTPLTRSVGTVEERAIKNIQILVFDGNNLDADNAKFLYSRYAWSKTGDNYRTILKIGSHLDIYTAVNAEALIINAGLTVGMTWSQVREKLILTTPQNIKAADGLPMWGYIHDYTIEDKPSNHMGTIKLLRSVSSADVEVTATNFTLVKGHIVFGADKGYLPFTPSNIVSDKASSPEAPSTMVANVDWNYTVDSGVKKITNVFYMYDNDAPDGDKRYTKVVLEGKWDSSTNPNNTFYPLAFRDAATNTKLKTIRNSKYVLIVTKVNGDGYPNLESAKQGDDVNMEYDVIPWNDNKDGDIMIDGPQYFAIPSRVATLYRNSGATKELVFTTNISLSDIKMTYSDADVAVSGTLDTHPRFKVEVVTLNDDNNLPYTCFRITAKQNYGTINNPATVIVTAGRLKFTLTLDQIDRNSDDWNSGGEDQQELG